MAFQFDLFRKNTDIRIFGYPKNLHILKYLWIFLVARKVANTVADETENLVRLAKKQ